MEALIALLILVVFVARCVSEYLAAGKKRTLPPGGENGGSYVLEENRREGEFFVLGYVAGDESGEGSQP